MNPARADAHAESAAAYVHIPFCSAVCPYCDFAVVAGRDELATSYVSAVEREIVVSPAWRRLDAVYFGGGTPSRLGSSLLGRILDRLRRRHGLADDAEVCLEANPEDFDEPRAIALVGQGFNRVSFGAQSFDDDVLSGLGRRHRRSDIRRSVEAARAAGFESVSIDLIYGTPGETNASWADTVTDSLDLGVDHLSAYALTVERGTPLGRAVAGGAPGPDPDVQADRFEMVDRMATAAGLDRYEVSNWARPGHECRYNLIVWAQGEFLGYGNGAHGFRGGRRYRNHRSVDAYLRAIQGGVSPVTGEDEVIGWDAEIDRLFVGLRREVGVSAGEGTDALLATDEGRALLTAGVIQVGEGRLRVARPLLTDAVHRSVVGLTAPNVQGDGDA
jgi:oxygen-independent coproporphyrinogen-3 oxidase